MIGCTALYRVVQFFYVNARRVSEKWLHLHMLPIFLIGYMGSGKSTLGRALSRATGMTLIDLDVYIESRYRKSVSEIFESQGEGGFRDVERRMLHEVSDFEDVIVACGGGTPCFFDNIEYMNTHGVTVLLEASEDVLFERLKVGRRKRPLIASMSDEELREFISKALSVRMPYYGKASERFCSDRLDDAEQIAESTAEFIKKFHLLPIEK